MENAARKRMLLNALKKQIQANVMLLLLGCRNYTEHHLPKHVAKYIYTDVFCSAYQTLQNSDIWRTLGKIKEDTPVSSIDFISLYPPAYGGFYITNTLRYTIPSPIDRDEKAQRLRRITGSSRRGRKRQYDPKGRK